MLIINGGGDLEIRGGFSTYELSTIEKDTFAEYLQHSMNNPALEFIKYLLGDDYIKFIDVMSGTTVKIPSAKSLERDLESVKIYLYVKRHGFTELSVKEAAKMYNKTVLTARRYALKVSKVLGVEDMLEGDDLNNYITYIKSVEQLDSYYYTKVEAKQDELREKRKEASEDSEPQELEVQKIIQEREAQEDKQEVTLEMFWEENIKNPNMIYLKEAVKDLQNPIEVRIRKVGNYIRILRDTSSPLADCVLNKSGWAIDLYFTDEESRDKAKSNLTEFQNMKDYGRSAITVRCLRDSDEIKKLIKVAM